MRTVLAVAVISTSIGYLLGPAAALPRDCYAGLVKCEGQLSQAGLFKKHDRIGMPVAPANVLGGECEGRLRYQRGEARWEKRGKQQRSERKETQKRKRMEEALAPHC